MRDEVAHRRGQERAVDLVALGEDHQPLDDVLELPDVPASRTPQVHHGVLGQVHVPRPCRSVSFARKCPTSTGMWSAARAAAASTPAPRSGGRRGPRGSVRRTSTARSLLVAAITRTSDPDGAVGAHRTNLLLLQHAQQLDLQRRARVADLVEEDGALLRELEQPGLTGPIAFGERAALRVRTSRTRGGPPASPPQLTAMNGCLARAREVDHRATSFPVPLAVDRDGGVRCARRDSPARAPAASRGWLADQLGRRKTALTALAVEGAER